MLGFSYCSSMWTRRLTSKTSSTASSTTSSCRSRASTKRWTRARKCHVHFADTWCKETELSCNGRLNNTAIMYPGDKNTLSLTALLNSNIFTFVKQILTDGGALLWCKIQFFFNILFSDFHFKQHNHNHLNRTEPQSCQTQIFMCTYKFSFVQVLQKYHTPVRMNFQITNLNGPEMSANLFCALDQRKHILG